MYLLLLAGIFHGVLCGLETITRGRFHLMPLLIAGILSILMLGALGTVSGMVMAFKGASAVSPEDRTMLMAMGFSVSLYTTSFGLLIAIPGSIGAGIAGVFKKSGQKA
jgi:hypothetical protein